MRDAPSARTLLDWYDRNAREMPWRVGPSARMAGVRPDPYHVWLSEVMLQQTTVAAVGNYFRRFTDLWPTLRDLAGAEDAEVMAEWAGLGYYARARNLLKCARIVAAEYGGQFPASREELIALPGIGNYTAAAIGAIAFDRPETVVDGNVERVLSRVFAVETPLPRSKPELFALAARLTPEVRAGDYAQAVMDLGAVICTPRSPSCGRCPWKEDCRALGKGIVAELPRKAPQKTKPIRFGLAYVARRNDGAWLLETRPDRGLLGGMLGWPGTDWREDLPHAEPPFEAVWMNPDLEVRHTFTHFHLRLALRLARATHETVPKRGRFVAESDFSRTDLPTVMRKVYDLAASTSNWIEDA